ncbi:MAG: GNAT family protein [Nanoarchaeota archaeon]
MNTTLLTYKNISLKVPEKEEYLELIDYFLEKEVAKNTTWCYKKLINKEIAEEMYQKVLKGLKERNNILLFIAKNDRAIGIVNLFIDHENKKGTLGINIKTSEIGKGIGTIALKMFLFYAFHFFDLNKVVLEVYSDNLRAKKVDEKVGFNYVGTKRKDISCFGKWRDVDIMEIFKEEFFKKNKEFIEELKKENNLE